MKSRVILQRGLGLTEVMIALFIISVGALGFLKVQISGVQSANDAVLRNSASVLMQDMIERIQANAADANLGLTSGYQTGTAAINNNCLSTTGSICTGNEMALHDRADWANNIVSSFPATSTAIGIVCLEGTPGDPAQSCSPPGSNPDPIVFTVKIFWKSWKNRDSGTYDQSMIGTVTPPK